MIFICSMLLVACQTVEEQPITIEQCASVPIARASATAFAFHGKGYIFGGRTQQRSGYLNDFWQYDPATNAWTQLYSPPLYPRTKAAAIVINDLVYIGLGYNGEGARVYTDSTLLTDWWTFDGNQWIQLSGMIETERYTNATTLFHYNGFIYSVYGIWSGATGLIYRYNIDHDDWAYVQPSNPRPEPVFGGVGAQIGNRCFFGTGYSNRNYNQWYEFFPDNQTWRPCSSMPDKGRVCATATVLKDKILVVGGRHFGGTLTDEHFYNDILTYSAADDKWTLRGTIPCGATENMFSFTINDTVYIGCGEDKNGNVRSEFYKIYE